MKKLFLILSGLLLIIIGLWRCQPEPAPTETDIIDNITGKWTAHLDDGSGVEQTYEVQIIKKNSSEFSVTNFINNGDTALVKLNGYHATVPKQVLNNVEVEGTGTVADNLQRIDFSLYLDGDEASMYLAPGGITK